MFNGDRYDLKFDFVADIWQEDDGYWYATIFQANYGLHGEELEYYDSPFDAQQTEQEMIILAHNWANSWE